MAIRVYSVRWVSGARDDLLAIADYVRQDGEQAAEDVTTAIEQRAASLRAFPGRGRKVPELEKTADRGHRELICAPWRIIYKARGESVTVLAVLDGRRNVADILPRILADRAGPTI